MSGYLQALRLLDTATLRALRETFGADLSRSRFAPPDEPTPALVDAVERPYDSVADAADRLARLESLLRDRRDRRAVFLTVYTRMTDAVRRGIAAGRFADPEWMRRYLVAFADHYRAAFLEFERGNLRAVPAPWRIAFGTALDGRELVLQDAFLGINAHINYDLALALDEVGIDPNRSDKYADHREIDDLLGRIVDAQQAALARVYAGGVADVDALFSRLDETLTLRSLVAAREQAWRVAVVRTDVPFSPVRTYSRWLLRTTATGGALLVLGPSLDPDVRRSLRRIETEESDLLSILDDLREAVQAVEF